MAKLTKMTNRNLFINAIRTQIGRPYIWGAQSEDIGFDCSGLIVWAMRKVYGDFPDTNAAGLYDKYHANKILVSIAKPGDLMFYGNSPSTIIHVMSVLDVWKYTRDLPYMTLVGARSGGAGIVTLDHAWTAKAYVGTAMGDYWANNFRWCCDPFLNEIEQ